MVWLVRWRRWRRAAFAAAALLALEALCATKFIVRDGHHHLNTAARNQLIRSKAAAWSPRWAFHPILGITPVPNYRSGEISHTAEGLRTTVNGGREGAPTVVVLGGSTTYDFIGDTHTWASRLSVRTGFHVVNLGVITYSSADHVVQTAFQVPAYAPSCAVYYVGWNDIRSNGLVSPARDYSDYHARGKYEELDIPDPFDFVPYTRLEHSALWMQVVDIARHAVEGMLGRLNAEFFAKRGRGKVSADVDPRVPGYFVSNMRAVVALNRDRGLRTVIIPQVLNASSLDMDEPAPWTPFIPGRATMHVMAAYNAALLGLAEPGRVWVLSDALAVDWHPEHFVDDGHFSESGADLFAATIAPQIQSICR